MCWNTRWPCGRSNLNGVGPALVKARKVPSRAVQSNTHAQACNSKSRANTHSAMQCCTVLLADHIRPVQFAESKSDPLLARHTCVGLGALQCARSTHISVQKPHLQLCSHADSHLRRAADPSQVVQPCCDWTTRLPEWLPVKQLTGSYTPSSSSRLQCFAPFVAHSCALGTFKREQLACRRLYTQMCGAVLRACSASSAMLRAEGKLEVQPGHKNKLRLVSASRHVLVFAVCLK